MNSSPEISDAPFTAVARALFNHADLSALQFRHHGLGMLQAELSKDVRLHLWHPSLRTLEGFRAVHDHRFDILSAVLHGAITDVRHHVCLDPRNCRSGYAYTPDVPVYSVVHAKAQTHTPADFKQVGVAHVVRVGSDEYSAGAVYSVPRYAFHTNTVDGMTVTVIHRTNFSEHPARVLGSGGGIVMEHIAAVPHVIELAKMLQVRP